jgi:hypothetical protein
LIGHFEPTLKEFVFLTLLSEEIIKILRFAQDDKAFTGAGGRVGDCFAALPQNNPPQTPDMVPCHFELACNTQVK